MSPGLFLVFIFFLGGTEAEFHVGVCQFVGFVGVPSLKTNISPEDQWLEDEKSVQTTVPFCW